MSAFVVGRDHIEAMVLLGLDGPSDPREVNPGTALSTLTWYVSDPRAVVWDHANPTAYFGGLEAIRHSLTRETAEETARMLAYANVASVQYRYSDSADSEDLPGSHDWSLTFADGILRRARTLPTAVEGLSILACFEYQSCERPDWDGSEAQRFCEALRMRLIHCLPGYSDAPWEWEWTRKAA